MLQHAWNMLGEKQNSHKRLQFVILHLDRISMSRSELSGLREGKTECSC